VIGAGDSRFVPHVIVDPASSVPTRLMAALAGALTVFAFAPFNLALLPVVTLGVLAWLWQHAQTPREGAWLGFAFGCGLFGAGVSWVYVALETFGGMPMPIAAIATAGFCAYLALFPALAGWSVVRFTAGPSPSRAVAIAAAWTLAEAFRGWFLTGFPWLALGYAQAPGEPLAGFAPLGGVWLVTLALALCAALFAFAIDRVAVRAAGSAAACLVGMMAIMVAGSALARISWTAPSGQPVGVSLVQGNVTQDLKFDPSFRERTFEIYLDLVARTRGKLVVLPESAFPLFAQEVPDDVVQALAAAVRGRDGDLLLGLFTMDPPPIAGGGPRYYNSVVSLGASPSQLYRKHHLVPFGETIPLEPLLGWLIRSVLAIPLDSQSAGPANPSPFEVAGQRVALNICYEDVFGDRIAAQAREATLLVNVTNDAWYGRSPAAWQHNQIAAMRALETGRPMLRATNTGVTSAIGPDGRKIAHLPWFTRGVLEVEIAGTTGLTPYVRYGDLPALLLATLMFAMALWRSRG
jgi:apolipoprotein N-acyltransferase